MALKSATANTDIRIAVVDDDVVLCTHFVASLRREPGFEIGDIPLRLQADGAI